MGDNIANQRKRILDVIGPSGRVTNLANVQYNTDKADIYATNFIGNFDGTFAVDGVDRGVIFKDGDTINAAPNFFYTDAGDVRIDSNLTVLGNFTIIGSNNAVLTDPIFEIASNSSYLDDTGYLINRPSGNVMIGHLSEFRHPEYANVLVMSYTDSSAYDTIITPDTSKHLEVKVIGNVTANYYSGNASQLISLTGAAAGTYGLTNSPQSIDFPIITVNSDGRITEIVSNTFTVPPPPDLETVVNVGNSTSNTVLFQNADVAFITTANVGIANSAPEHTLSIGSNIYFDDTGSNTLVTTANLSALYITSNGKYLTDTTDASPGVNGEVIDDHTARIPIISVGLDGRINAISNTLFTVVETSNLDDVVNRGNATANTVQFTNPTTSFVTSSNIGIANAAPGHLLSVGANLYIERSGNLVTQNNVHAQRYFGNAANLVSTTDAAAGIYGGVINNNSANIATISVGTNGRINAISHTLFTHLETSNLAEVVNRGNVTANTVQFTNASTAFITTANVGIANSNPQHQLSVDGLIRNDHLVGGRVIYANAANVLSTTSNITYNEADGIVTIDDTGGGLNARNVLYINKFTTAVNVLLGQPVYITPQGASGQIDANLALNTSATYMPAAGLALSGYTKNGPGYVVTGGTLKNIPDSIFTVAPAVGDIGNPVYISEISGKLTLQRPALPTQFIQNIGLLTRAVGSVNSILVRGAGRANDTPNRLLAADANIYQTVTIGGGSIRSSTNLYVTGNAYISSNIVTGGRIGIANTSPGHLLSVGANLYVDGTGSNVLVTSGNVSASRYHGNANYLTNTTDAAAGVYGGSISGQSANIAVISVGLDGRINLISNSTFTVSETSNLEQVVNRGNVTSNTVQFTNATTSFVTLSNVGIGNTNPQHLLSLGEGEIFFNGNVVVLATESAISIGTVQADQEPGAIAIGDEAGETLQESNTVAIGVRAGRNNQGTKGVAIGDRAGESDQTENGISIGEKAGQSTQGSAAIAIGQQAGQSGQNNNAISIGRLAGQDRQGDYAVAIGDQAGSILQGSNSIAIGRSAARDPTQVLANTIVLNASGGDLNPIAIDSVYIKNFRNSTTQYTNVLSSNLTSGEVITSSIVVSDLNVGLGGNTSPAHELSVEGNTYSNIITQIIRFDDGVEDSVIQGLTLLDVTQNGNNTVETLRFNNATTSFVTASNVGIGTTSPSAPLEVAMAATDYQPTIKIGTATTYTDGMLYLIRLGGNTQQGIGLYPAARGVFAKKGTSIHFQNDEEFSIKTTNWVNLFGLDSTKAYIKNNLGIGTTTPYAKLHVNGTGGTLTGVTARFFNFETVLSYSTGANFGPVSIFASDDIIAGGWIGSTSGTMSASDSRIKENIQDINDTVALDQLRLLKPKTYQYKDTIKRGTESVIGFIAQEVKEVIPTAVTIRTQSIPNIYEIGNVSQSNVITFTNFNTSNLNATSNIINIKTVTGGDERITLANLIDEHTIQVVEDLSTFTGSVDENGNVITETITTTYTQEEYDALESKDGINVTYTPEITKEEYEALTDEEKEAYTLSYSKSETVNVGDQIFVYGQEVDDFNFLKKDSIFTIATAALQEVDRQQQMDKARISALEEKCDGQQEQISALLARIESLENANP